MNDFFEQVILDNTVRQYCIVFGVILFTLALKRLISKYFAGLLFLMVNKIWKDIDKKSFTGLVVKPLGFFLLVLVSIIALHKLTFPGVLNADIYRFTVKEFIHTLGSLIFIIFFDKPFVIGDAVKIQHFTGSVEKIGLRSTRIRTEQKTTLTVPNKQMVDSILDNHSQRTQRRGDLKLDLSIHTSSASITAVVNGIKEILTQKDIETFHVHFSEITTNASIIIADYYTAPLTAAAFNEIKESVNLQVLKLLEEREVEIAGANADIRVSGNLK